MPTESASNTSENYWVTEASMQQPRSALGVGVVDGRIYAIGGSTETGFSPGIPGYAAYSNINVDSFMGTNEEYNAASNMWSYKAVMPTARIAFATAVYEGQIYCIGGRSMVGSATGGYTGVNEVYDPLNDTWVTKTSMPTARGWLGAGEINGKIYVIGGEGSNGRLNEVYDIAKDSWVRKADVPVSAEVGLGSVVAVMDNKLYVIGQGVQIYDPVTDSWSQGTSVPTFSWITAAGATTGVLAPKGIYVVGPQDNFNPSNIIYNPQNDSWTFGTGTLTQRYNFAVAVVDDKLYAIGGHTYDVGHNGYFEPVGLNEQYTPLGYRTVKPSPTISSSPTMPISSENPDQPISEILIAFAVVLLVSISIVVFIFAHKRRKNAG